MRRLFLYGLRIVASTAEAGNIDFDNIGFHKKPPVTLCNKNCFDCTWFYE